MGHTIQRVKKFLVDLWNDTVHRVFQQGDRPWIFQAVIQVGDNFLVRTSPFFVTKVSFIKLKVFLENILDKYIVLLNSLEIYYCFWFDLYKYTLFFVLKDQLLTRILLDYLYQKYIWNITDKVLLNSNCFLPLAVKR